ncbi:MAG: glycosyltransferase family A protein, partial [Flavobacteriaceae bacterium]|nr:glycosyltransferase family A protein [Flavobacteriaceae bacterium]
MPQALVSICIPTYNGAAYLAEALESAIGQTYPHLEIVVSDDASTDDTLEIVESFKQKTQLPIRAFHHTPSGIGANWNHCMQKAQGEYIKFLFQDDVLMPDCVEKMVAAAEKHPQAGMIGSKRVFLTDSSVDNQEMKNWIKVFGNLQSQLFKDKN